MIKKKFIFILLITIIPFLSIKSLAVRGGLVLTNDDNMTVPEINQFKEVIKKSTIAIWHRFKLPDGQIQYNFKGSGVLIYENVIITAAHVIANGGFENLRFTFGDLPKENSPIANSIQIHPEYFDSKNPQITIIDYDIAVIHLTENLLPNNSLKPGFNLTAYKDLGSYSFIVAGFGAKSEEEVNEHTQLKRQGFFKQESVTLSAAKLQMQYHNLNKDYHPVINGESPSSTSACPGDSGGPVWSFFNPIIDNYPMLVAIVNSGVDCNKGAGKYLLLNKHILWIDNAIQAPLSTIRFKEYSKEITELSEKSCNVMGPGFGISKEGFCDLIDKKICSETKDRFWDTKNMRCISDIK